MISGPMGITVRNVNHALPIAATLFRDKESYRRIAPRTGDVTLEYLVPVVTVFKQPLERVLFSPERDANHFFHFFEALWILAGRDDVKWLSFFLPRIKDYSDNGSTFHGAYGARMRRAMCVEHDSDHVDQLGSAIAQLKHDPSTRRAVVGLWQPGHDTGYSGKDMPCNCTITFKVREGRLNMTVFNRSNDVVWGAYGANIVQFSTIMEYVAAALGVEVGTYHHWSDSYHVYDNAQWQRLKDLDQRARFDPYEESAADYLCKDWPGHITAGYEMPLRTYALMNEPDIFDTELEHFLNYVESFFTDPITERAQYAVRQNYENIYFDDVAMPMLNAFLAFKRGEFGGAKGWLDICAAADWRLACTMWLHRRATKEARHA